MSMPWWIFQLAWPSRTCSFSKAPRHWVNKNNLLNEKFAWGRGYGVFSVSHSGASEAAKYIGGQEEHHRKRSFSEEFRMLVERYGLKWHEDKTVETVPGTSRAPTHPTKVGC